MKKQWYAKKLAKAGYNYYQAGVVALATAAGIIDFPVPPNSSMRKTGTHTIRKFYESGIRTYLPIAVAALREGVDLFSGIRVLDFGCGVGRQLLHFTRRYPAPSYSASTSTTPRRSSLPAPTPASRRTRTRSTRH